MLEFRPAGAENRAVAGVGDDPKSGVRNGFGHFDGKFDRIQRVAVTLDNESAGFNGGEQRWREVQVVIAGGKGLGAGEDGFDLLIAARMATAQDFPLLFGESVGVVAHQGTGLRRKVRSGADQHHGSNAARVLGGHVQQDDATAADAN